jgi:hypothetical protein
MSTNLKAMCDGFRFEAPTEQYGLVLDGFVTFWGTRGQIAHLKKEIKDGLRGTKPKEIRTIRLTIDEVVVL